MKTITQKEEQHAAACCSETKNRYICISEESEGTSPDTLFETLPIKKMCNNWVAVINDRLYIDLLAKQKWIGYRVDRNLI